MLNWIDRTANGVTGRAIRGTAAAITMLLIAAVVLFPAKAPAQTAHLTTLTATEDTAIADEHRFTKLETEVATIHADLESLNDHVWVGLPGLLGLCGEAAIRVVRRVKE